jgi:hypothetical protein
MDCLFDQHDLNIELELSELEQATTTADHLFDILSEVTNFKVAVEGYGYTSPMKIVGADILSCIDESTSVSLKGCENKFNVESSELIVKGCEELLKTILEKIRNFFIWVGEKIFKIFRELAEGVKSLIAKCEVLYRMLRSRRRVSSGTEAFQLKNDSDLQLTCYTLTRVEYEELEKVIVDRLGSMTKIQNFVKSGGLYALMMDGSREFDRKAFEEMLSRVTNGSVTHVTRNIYTMDLMTQKMMSILNPSGGAPQYRIMETLWDNEENLEAAIMSCQKHAKSLLMFTDMRYEFEKLKKAALKDMEQLQKNVEDGKQYSEDAKMVAKNMVNGTTDMIIIISNLIEQVKKCLVFIIRKIEQLEAFLARHR